MPQKWEEYWSGVPVFDESGVEVADKERSKSIRYGKIYSLGTISSIDRVKELDYVLTPGRYVGLPDDEDDFDFNERFTGLKAEFEAQLKEEEKLNALILENLKKVKAG